MSRKVLVTGGAGYLGSHTCVSLLQAGYEVVVADNLSNSDFSVIENIEKVCGKKPDFVELDLRDEAALTCLFQQHPFHAVMHFAGLKSAFDSVQRPFEYFDTNINTSINLLKTMSNAGVFNLIFSSSAAVYGSSLLSPLKENLTALEPSSPYAVTKYNIEKMLLSMKQNDPSWNIISLRYFNPIGAHPSGYLGELHQPQADNLMHAIYRVVLGKQKELTVFGTDYDTEDGSAIRDFIHVMDIAQGHLNALQAIENKQLSGTFNLGTGQGCSVLNLINTFESVTGVKIPVNYASRRNGDIPVSYADAGEALDQLNWQATFSLEQMCQDSFNWLQRKYIKLSQTQSLSGD